MYKTHDISGYDMTIILTIILIIVKKENLLQWKPRLKIKIIIKTSNIFTQYIFDYWIFNLKSWNDHVCIKYD